MEELVIQVPDEHYSSDAAVVRQVRLICHEDRLCFTGKGSQDAVHTKVMRS